MAHSNPFAQTVSSFHGIALPEAEMSLAGYSAIIGHFGLRLPLPDGLAAISAKHRRYEKEPWSVFDATRQAEFLYECVQQTVETTLPEEVAYLERHDRMKSFIGAHFDMPDKFVEILIAFLRQGGGKLSKRARAKELSQLTEKEVAMIEEKFSELFSP